MGCRDRAAGDRGSKGGGGEENESARCQRRGHSAGVRVVRARRRAVLLFEPRMWVGGELGGIVLARRAVGRAVEKRHANLAMDVRIKRRLVARRGEKYAPVGY